MKPATPLPWGLRLTKAPTMRDRCITLGPEVGVVLTSPPLGSPEQAAHIEDDTRYVAHAANAYPRLVALLQGIKDATGYPSSIEFGRTGDGEDWMDDARALLAELGEMQP